MKVTAVTMAVPTQPAAYSWEATDAQVAARYGVPIEAIVQFDLNTSPAPPSLVKELLAAGRFERPLSEYPPSDYARLIAAAAARYGVAPEEVLVGAGADEVLDVIGKVFVRPSGRTVIPTPSYAMYRVVTEQRGATVVAVPRLADEGYVVDVEAVCAAASDPEVDVVWLCDPNNPTALPEPPGAIERLLAGIAEDAAGAGREPAIVVIDEAYAEFVDRSHVALRERFRDLILVRTASKAYALAGLRVGFAIARPEVIDRLNPFRPPGSVSTLSVEIVTAALEHPDGPSANIARVERERERLREGLIAAGWRTGRSVTNFLLVDLGTPERARTAAEGLLRHGLVPRTFPAEHPLADHLRLTIRDPGENDRLLDAVREIDLEATA